MILFELIFTNFRFELRRIMILSFLRKRVEKFLIFKKDFNLSVERRLKEGFNGSLIFAIEKTFGSFGERFGGF